MKLNLFKKTRNSIIKDNSGMALVTVIVAIGFVAALVSVLMLTTLVNFKMKNVNERSKDTFYSAEQAIDEINIGLQQVVSESLSEAYMEIMNNYQNDEIDKNQLLTTKYYEAIWDRLEVADKGNGYYDVNKLEEMLKPTTRWHTVGTDGYGAIVVGVVTEGTDTKEEKYGEMITYQKSGVVLKNVKVYYKDQMGFVSVIQTDIKLNYPNFDFAQSSEVPTIAKYAFVADNGAEIKSKDNVALSGNIYANQIEFINTSPSNKMNIFTTDNQSITSKYDFILGKGSEFTGKELNRDANGEIASFSSVSDENIAITLRAKNLIVDSANVNFSGNLLLANDINIKGKNSKVKLSGELAGYGMGVNMGDSSDVIQWTGTDSDWSSAILINGKNTELDLSGLKEITLYGHAFVGTDTAKYFNNRGAETSDYASEFTSNIKKITEQKTYNKVAMGESVAVKTNQMLYLLPPGAIGVDDTGKSMIGKNPMTQDEYANLMDAVENDEVALVSSSVVVPELGTSLEQYALKNNTIGIEKIWARVNDPEVKSLVYFYIYFDDEAKANRYYSNRYEGSKEKFDKYTKNYLNNIKWPNTDTILTFNTAGNAMDITGAEKDVSKIPASITAATSSDAHKNKSLKYLKEFKGMCNRLEAIPHLRNGENSPEDIYAVTTIARSYEDDMPNYQIVYENIIDDESIDKFVDKINGQAFDNVRMVKAANGLISVYDVSGTPADEQDTPAALTAATTRLIALIWDEDSASASDVITIDDSYKDVKLVITKKDVVVKRDFKGLILTDGKIRFEKSDLKIESDPDVVRNILTYGYKEDPDDDESKMITIAVTFHDGKQYVYSGSSNTGYTANLALGNMITYENWKKD